jgi:DNA-binding transcriptional regulator YiaG
MSFAQEIKNIRQHCFLSQEAFCERIEGIFFICESMESGRSKPNLVQ